ncbi:LOW QUALITY PROTEIN: actin-like protein 10 [Morus bassanus]
MPVMPKPAVIIDNSSSFTQAGFAGQKKPKFVLRTLSLHPCSAGTMWETQRHPTTTESAAGFAVAPRTRSLKHSTIEDWDGMESVWSHLFFCGLKVLPEKQHVLMANSPSCPSSNREKLAEVLFESFGVPVLHMANIRLLSLCTYARVTGLAVEVGAGAPYATSNCLGKTWREDTYYLGEAGGFLSSYLHSLQMESPNDPSVLKALKKTTVILKKQCCYASMDYKEDLNDQGYHHPARFQVPDEHWITLDKERFCCPEPLFQVKLLYQNSPGLHHLALQSLQKVSDHARRDTVGNIVLSESSTFPGFPERMCLELNALFHSMGCQIQVLASLEKGTATWTGGLKAVSLTSFQHAWMTKGDYQEHGAKYVHKIFQRADDKQGFKASHWWDTAPAAGGGSACSGQSCSSGGDRGPAAGVRSQFKCSERSKLLLIYTRGYFCAYPPSL